jgi:hypothetical protein
MPMTELENLLHNFGVLGVEDIPKELPWRVGNFFYSFLRWEVVLEIWELLHYLEVDFLEGEFREARDLD